MGNRKPIVNPDHKAKYMMGNRYRPRIRKTKGNTKVGRHRKE